MGQPIGSGRRLRAGGLCVGLLACAAAATPAAADEETPVIADLVGRWECKDGYCERIFLEIDSEADNLRKLSARTMPKDDASGPGKQWDFDPNVDPGTGAVWLSRAPKAEEIDDHDAPLWARKMVEGDLRWQIRLRAARGVVKYHGLVGEECRLTLTGRLITGKINFDEGTNKASVETGKDADGKTFDMAFGKTWYEPPQIDEQTRFRWANAQDAQSKLGVTVDDDVLTELNNAVYEKGVLKIYRALVSDIFKSLTYVNAIQGAVNALTEEAAEEVVEEWAKDYVGNLIEGIVGNAIQGDPIGREIFISALAATAGSVLVGHLLPIDALPHDAVVKKLGEALSEGLSEPVTEHAKAKEPLKERLENAFGKQCRFAASALQFTRGVSGLLVADKAKREAALVLYVPKGKSGHSAVVKGHFTYGQEGLPPPILLEVLGGS